MVWGEKTLLIFFCGMTLSNATPVEEGKKIFYSGEINCIGCHSLTTTPNPNTFGPKLQYLSLWSNQALYDQIYNPQSIKSFSLMPPFGKNGILNDKQIKALVAYLKTIN